MSRMNTKARVDAVLNSASLTELIPSISSFDMSALEIAKDVEFYLPENLRLGHLIEKIVAQLIHASSNYNVICQNIQLFESEKTIGELDFILEHVTSRQIIHMELAYKFYLYDPKISGSSIHKWVGPNRNDSLIEKLEKLKTKQLPLLYHESAQSKLDPIEISQVTQQLCFLASLFIPYQYSGNINPMFRKAVRGFYMDYDACENLNTADKSYYLPPKQEWGMEPSANQNWTEWDGIKDQVTACIAKKQAPLCWQKKGESYSSYFCIWW